MIAGFSSLFLGWLAVLWNDFDTEFSFKPYSVEFIHLLFVKVIFPALDIRVKNVARTYSLEHEGESFLFDQLFEILTPSKQSDENFWRELASRTRALQTSISQHMSKEEEQVSFFLTHIIIWQLYIFVAMPVFGLSFLLVCCPFTTKYNCLQLKGQRN